MWSHLFVYGTLRRQTGSRISRWLSSLATPLGPARMKGYLYDLGDFPAMVLAGNAGDWVSGELYKLHDPAQTLPVLDRYEGPQFRRAVADAYLHDGSSVRCFVYLYAGNLDGAARRKV